MTERDKLKLWNMQVGPRPWWQMLALRIWRKADD